MKIHITENFHHKNQSSLIKGITLLNHKIVNNIQDADLIYSPNNPIDISKYPDKKFIFGPHFSIYIEGKCIFNDIHKNAVYIQPSEWVRSLWVDEFNYQSLPVIPHAFGVDTDEYRETKTMSQRKRVMVYFKRRKRSELNRIETFLRSKEIDYDLIEYGKYKNRDYVDLLHDSKYCIWLGCHESQGFALEEALSCNVPLLVWNVTKMIQEEGCDRRYKDIKTVATTIPYWDDRCGVSFTDENELETKYNEFIQKLETFKPREYILENLTIKQRTEKFFNLL